MNASAIALRQAVWPDDGALFAAPGSVDSATYRFDPVAGTRFMECVLPIAG
ncbi:MULTISPECIES: hypothetical protein [Pseudoxanthomonas]|uniref:Uncharacterized protein n=1 Tax=Pseudoxanthomonas winnipegensis TaxID=2480810 RepID=A0AAW8GGV2_9GAMM|nr:MULTISPECIES: hypothetical protein [Pseudoxanthomonas]MDQ1120348.1 hypothetical protein [Pseudoxanthomonas winnipegensis]MDQ1133564.1 hypothetical protein [Pseudoxanthomonas winnipegensis]MDR6140194.1 hypothetical protein [Pseudoxanthomonas sp. SORGH_AS_0997]